MGSGYHRSSVVADSLSLLLPDNEGTKVLAHEKHTKASD